MTEWKFSLDSIKTVAAELLQRFPGPRVFAFHAGMGAGKTTFIHALCTVMKVNSTISSPTFSIINEYSSPAGVIYHLDLYRLKNEEEAIRAGVEDCLYSGFMCLAEWPERAPALFPADAVHVYLEAIDEQTRLMRVADK
jgi:tRNA threonylcarbamoyladenosine biosynthesis protein TsaE